MFQWSRLGLRTNYPMLSLAIAESNFVITLFQETLVQDPLNFNINYTAFHITLISGQIRGISTFVKSSLHCQKLDPDSCCGTHTEYVAIQVSLENPLTSSKVYHHKNNWFYNKRVCETKHGLNRFIKLLHKTSSIATRNSFNSKTQ